MQSMMRCVLILAAFLIAAVGCSSSRGDRLSTSLPEREPGRIFVDATIDDVVARGVFPFLYVRVETMDGAVVYEHSAHNPQFTTRVPTGDSWMRLWSMSKSVTIATILRLEEEGILSRSDPVTDFIPELDRLIVLSADANVDSCDRNLTRPRRALTVEDLLNHNDGFYYPFTGIECLDEAMNKARLPEATSSDDLIGRIARLRLHPEGVGSHYYGIGTTILGLVAERATGKSFDHLVRSRITKPLGVADTLRYTKPEGVELYPRITGVDGTLRPATEKDLNIFGGPVPQYRPDTNIFLGGEGMVGTTRSFAAFLRLMGSHGELGGTRILREATVRDWYSPKTQLDSAYGHNGYNIWVTSGKFDGLPDQKPGLLVGGGYEGTAFWIDPDGGFVGLVMSQVHQPATQGVDEVSRIRGIIYDRVLEPVAIGSD